MKKFFNIENIRLAIVFAVVLFLYSFTSARNHNRKLIRSEVIFIGENTNFVTQETVNKLLIDYKTDVKTIAKEKVFLTKVEKAVNNHPMIEKAQVFMSVDGVLKATVKQRNPIGRIFENEGSSYIDYQGASMPLSDQETARVPIITGSVNAENYDNLVVVLKQIYDDDFLRKNITGLQIMPDQSVLMTNRMYDFKILFGKLINSASKFKNYKAFFQKAEEGHLLTKYKNINLIYNHQVVGTK